MPNKSVRRTDMEFEELRRIIAEKLDIEEETITENSRFTEDLGADSLDLLEIGTEVEDILQTQVPEEDLTNIKTVEDALEVINDAV